MLGLVSQGANHYVTTDIDAFDRDVHAGVT
jgi:hypothetical protein